MKLILTILTFSISFGSWEAKSPLPFIVIDTPLLKQELWNSELLKVYSYNDARLITEEKNKISFTKHYYNEKNQLIRTEFYLDPSVFGSTINEANTAQARNEWITPDNTTLNKVINYDYDELGRIVKSSDRSGYELFTYDTHNRITKRMFYHDDKNGGGFEYYYDKNGNLVKQKHLFAGLKKNQLVTTVEYKFDSKHNPYRAFNMLPTPGKNTNLNNIIEEITTSYLKDMGIPKQTKRSVYEYNDNDYPTRLRQTTEHKGHPEQSNTTIEFVYN